MQWLEKLNDSLDYLEKNLEGTPDLAEAAKIACCSPYHYQRMFSYLAGVPLSEYLRRRRMTRAAFDLQNGGKVLDVALKYGYESPTAFNRAFQSVHGVAPSAAQHEGANLKSFQRISFIISIKGETEMEYRIVTKEGFRVVGLSEPIGSEAEESFKIVPKLWGKAAMDGTVARLAQMMDCGPADSGPMGILGISACMPGENWHYLIAAATTKAIPEDMPQLVEYQVPACTWAVFPGHGSMPDSIQELEKRVISEWLPGSGYEYADAPDMEVYLEPNPADAKFEVWVPVRKK